MINKKEISGSQSPDPSVFYNMLPIHEDFDDILDVSAYLPVPDNWFVGMTDIIGSTKAVEAGEYKTVNTVGAAVISAQLNAVGASRLPYIFGGDGAAFTFWPQHEPAARKAIAEVMTWAKKEFDLEVRGAIIPISHIREAGFDVLLARYQVSPGIDYAMFEGGGLTWAENKMKSGHYAVQTTGDEDFPDLEGLSCRWTPMQAKNGLVLSLLALPVAGAPASEVAALFHQLIGLVEQLDRSGHPVPEEGPGYVWPPQGIELEARASHRSKSVFRRKVELWLATLLALFFFKTGVKAGEFDPEHYTRTVGRNADFRKFEDGLKMTIDCDVQTRDRIRQLLQVASDAGLVRFGLFEQNEAIMTCIVPSVTSDDHMHFIDGASGGYTSAAAMIKNHAPLTD